MAELLHQIFPSNGLLPCGGMQLCGQPFPSTDNLYHFHLPAQAHPCGIEAQDGIGCPVPALPWRDNRVSAWTCEAFVSPYSAPARTAESRTSVQDIIDTPSVSKASGTKRGAVSLAPSGWSMHKTRALRHSLRWRTLKRTDLHCPDFTATAPPPYVKNCHYSHLSEFCTRQQY